MPGVDPRPGDERAVVEAVAQLGERTEAARQARVDDLDRDPHRQDGLGDFLAGIGLARTRRQVVAELECELALELGGDEVGDAQLRRPGGGTSCIQGCSSGAPIATSTPSDSRCAGGHGGDLPAADGAELARDRGLQSIRLGEIARQALLGPGLDRPGIAPWPRRAPCARRRKCCRSWPIVAPRPRPRAISAAGASLQPIAADGRRRRRRARPTTGNAGRW